MAQKILIAQPTAWMREFPTVANWKAALVTQLATEQNLIKTYQISFCNKSRIHNSRNGYVETALEQGYDWLLFVDPDMHPDLYYKPGMGYDGPVRQFFPSSLGFMLQHPEVGVVAAPACSGPPELYVNVYVPHSQGGCVKLPRVEAARMEPGMLKVAAIGTGVMLIRMSIFKDLKPPYFADTYNDERQVDVNVGQDCYFCEKVIQAGYGVYANMYAWAGHWKDFCVGKPGLDGLPIDGMNFPNEESIMFTPESSAASELEELCAP